MLEIGKYLESVLHLFEYIIIYYVFSQIFVRRFNSDYISYIIILLLVFTNVSIELAIGVSSMSSTIIKLTLLLISLLVLFKSKIINTLIIFVLTVIALGICDFAAISIAAFVFKQDGLAFVNIGFNRFFLGLFSKFIFLVTGQIIVSRFKSVPFLNSRNFYQLLMVLLLNTAFIILVIDFYIQNNIESVANTSFVVTIMVGIIGISFLMIKFTENIVEYSKRERDWQLQEEEYRRQTFYMNHLDEINQQMKSLRHDFNNHINCLQGMLEHGDLSSAKEYTLDLVEEAEQFNIAFSTKHAGISGLLSSKYEMMRTNKIAFTSRIDLPDELRIKLVDISIILGNAIDNAIEACLKVDESKRSIDLKVYEEIETVVIKIENSYMASAIREGLKTSKSNVDQHGYGLNNIRFVVNKYDGYMKIEHDSKKFYMNLALPN